MKRGNNKASRPNKDGLKRDTKQQRRGRSTKRERQAAEIENTAVQMSRSNDASWHSKFPNFTHDATKFPFATPLGSSLVTARNDRITTPGVMGLTFIPTIGYSADATSAVNRSTSRFRSYLRSVQKASADYDGADIMIILMAVDSLLLFHKMCCRAYKICNLWSPVNKYYPEALLLACGIDPSIRFEMDQFRGFINQLGINLTRFVMPKNFDINSRHEWMVEGLYLDSNANRAQTYIFNPAGFWVYDNTNPTGGALKWLAMPNSNNAATLSTLITMATQMLNALASDDDVDIINGDLYAAYGREGIKPIAEVSDLDVVIPSYDPVVLSMIENATVTGGFAPGYTPTITQDPNVNGRGLLFTPTFAGTALSNAEKYSINAVGSNTNVIINMHLDSPSPDAVLEATRLMVASTQDKSASTVDGRYAPDIFGSDVIAEMDIYYYSSVTPENGVQKLVFTGNTIPDTLNPDNTQWTYSSVLSFLSMVENFDWAPLLYWCGLGSTGVCDIRGVFGDIDNITTGTPQQLNWIHEASLLSLFDVPEFAGRIERAGNSI